MSKLRCAVIGVGYLGRFHAQKYSCMSNIDFVGVYDSYHPQAQLVAEELNVNCFSSLEEVCRSADAVSIATTTSAHFAVTKYCLESGLHVLVEKPLTETILEAQELINLAAAKKLTLQVGHLERYNPAFQAFLPCMEKIKLIEGQRLATFKKRGSDVDVILDLMIHDLDLVWSLMKSEVVDIHAQGLSIITHSTDVANVSLTFANGCVANLTASRVNSGLERIMRIYQQDCFYALNFQQQSLMRFKPNHGAIHDQFLIAEEIACQKNDALNAQIHDFVNSVQNGAPVKVDGYAGFEVLNLANKIQAIIEQEKSFG